MNRNDSAGSFDKAALRRLALDRRNALSDEERTAASRAVVGNAAPLLLSLLPGTVGFTWPMGSECDIRPLIELAVSNGATAALPTIVERTRLLFRAYRPGDRLVPAGFGTSEPVPESPAVRPDILIVPMVAFDRTGMRLGYGKGYYDRAIAELGVEGRAPRLIGAAFAAQEVDAIPHEPHDVRLEWIVTEAGIRDFRTGKD